VYKVLDHDLLPSAFRRSPFWDVVRTWGRRGRGTRQGSAFSTCRDRNTSAAWKTKCQ